MTRTDTPYQSHLILIDSLLQDTLVQRKYDKDPRLAAWVESQRVLWNRDFREAGEGTSEAKTGAQLDFFQGNDPPILNHDTYGAEDKDMSLPDAADADIEFSNNLEKDGREGNVAEQMTRTSIDAANKEDLESMNLPTELKRLSVERKEKLDLLGFVWSLRTKRIEDHWDDMYRQVSDQRLESSIGIKQYS